MKIVILNHHYLKKIQYFLIYINYTQLSVIYNRPSVEKIRILIGYIIIIEYYHVCVLMHMFFIYIWYKNEKKIDNECEF